MKAKSAYRANLNAGGRNTNDRAELERHSWRNWVLLSSIAIISTICLLFTLPPLITESAIDLWPWAPTDLVLLCGLVLAVTVFVLHLTQQQRDVVKMRSNITALERETLANSEKNTQRLYALLNVSRIMGTMTDLQQVFDTITRLSAEAFECNRASLMVVVRDTDELVVRSTSEGTQSKILNMRKKIGDGISGWVAKNRTPLLLGSSEDFKRFPELPRRDSDITAAMVVPIILRDELVGILNISTRAADARYDEVDLKALEVFAANAGACIRHSEQSAWMRQTIQNLQQTSAAVRN